MEKVHRKQEKCIKIFQMPCYGFEKVYLAAVLTDSKFPYFNSDNVLVSLVN